MGRDMRIGVKPKKETKYLRLKALGLLFKSEQGSVRHCDKCGGKRLQVISREALLKELDENSCGKSSCAACGEDCEIIVLKD